MALPAEQQPARPVARDSSYQQATAANKGTSNRIMLRSSWKVELDKKGICAKEPRLERWNILEIVGVRLRQLRYLQLSAERVICTVRNGVA